MVEDIAKRTQERLQRDVGDRYLRVAFDHSIERFKVGQESSLVSGQIYWFYILTDGNSGYRNPDEFYEPLLRKILALNMNNQKMRWTPAQFVAKSREIQDFNRQKSRDEIQYRLRSEARAFLRAAEKDGMR